MAQNKLNEDKTGILLREKKFFVSHLYIKVSDITITSVQNLVFIITADVSYSFQSAFHISAVCL